MKSYPLQWPSGWRRTPQDARKDAPFKHARGEVSITHGTQRILRQLRAFRVEEGDAIISTNLLLRLDGQPRGDQKEPADPGVAIYWKLAEDAQHKVMAVDRYARVADNLAAVAATLEAMRLIERHGGAVILERAFTGFLALPAPNTWRAVLGFKEDDIQGGGGRVVVRARYQLLSKERHPDRGGTEAGMAELNWAWAEAQKELS